MSKFLRKLFGQKISNPRDMKDVAYPVIDISGWDDNKIRVRLRKVSLMAMVKEGKLPNELLSLVVDLSSGKIGDTLDNMGAEQMKQFYDLLLIVAKESLVSPTYEEIIKEVESLPEQTLVDIWLYNLYGLRALENFRKRPKSFTKSGTDSKILEEISERLSTGERPSEETNQS